MLGPRLDDVYGLTLNLVYGHECVFVLIPGADVPSSIRPICLCHGRVVNIKLGYID